MIEEVRRGVHHAEDLDHPLDAIERAELVAQGGKDGQADLAGGGMAGGEIEIGSDAAADERAVGANRPVSGNVGEPLHDDQWPVDGDRTRSGRQHELQVREILLGGVHRETEQTAGRTRGESFLATRPARREG